LGSNGALHFSQPAITRFIDDGIKGAFEPNLDTVVVSHSLGTLVAYHLINGFDPSYRITHLVTLGSPLGIPTIQRMLRPFTRPPGVGQWFNARDPKDIVALYPLTPPTFNLQDVVDKSDVANFTPNHHSIPGYLQDPTVACWIHDALI
jgi:pimeloyl-ACP methyl ester carboxylesterase